MSDNLDTTEIKKWRSIVTLVVFVVTNVIVLFPFHIPFWIPRPLSNAVWDLLSAWRIISPRDKHNTDGMGTSSRFVRLAFPMNFVTAPLIADLFLLAILAIGRQEIYDGTIGSNGISPIDIMAFFLTLAYIAISIDASGLIRYLAFRVLKWGGKVGHRLFFSLYVFFFALSSFIGNDPVILSGTAFLAYMTRVASNIVHPKAWIHTQFTVANIASAILVSSNPTNLVLAGAFQIKFIYYTANMIVPVIGTAIVLFPFLLYIVFADPDLIPISITMHDLPDDVRDKTPVNPNIPHARGTTDEEAINSAEGEERELLSLEEIMNPFLDKWGAGFGAIIMATTLITLLALNAARQGSKDLSVYWVTVPAAFVMLCWDIASGWVNRHQTREIARKGREAVERAAAKKIIRDQDRASRISSQQDFMDKNWDGQVADVEDAISPISPISPVSPTQPHDFEKSQNLKLVTSIPAATLIDEKQKAVASEWQRQTVDSASSEESDEARREREMEDRIQSVMKRQRARGPTTLTLLIIDTYKWAQETFPTVTAVLAHLPFALVPFALSMFVLVQALVTKGWVPVFAYAWDHWVNKTGTAGALCGMAFLSTILCNFAGTNIGTSILLSRVLQSWQDIHNANGIPISDRTFWGSVYSMALGVNYGAFSTAFSASLAGLLWRDILRRKHIEVRPLEFARANFPIIAISMTIGSVILLGEIYIIRKDTPYSL